MKKTIPHITLLILVAFLMPSCKKEVITAPGNSYQTVKVYNDSLISYPYTIVSGTNILVLSYQTGTSQSTLMATDNKGVLLWKTPIGNSIVSGILIQNDGSYTLIGNNAIGNTASLYMYNLNSEGTITANYTYNLPANFNSYTNLGIIRSVSGNNLIFTNITDDYEDTTKGYIMECDHSGNMLWAKQYLFPQSKSSFEYTLISDVVITPDGGYLFCGFNENATWGFFLMKTDSKGNIIWTKFHNTGNWNSATYQITPYGTNTTSLIPLNNGNYLLFIGSYTSSLYYALSKSEWVYTLSSSGDSLNSTQIILPLDNFPVQAIRNNNGSIFALLNQTYNLPAGNGSLPQNTTFESLNSNLTLNTQGYFQTIYNDYFQSLCFTSDGNIACFGMIQSEGKSSYKPELIITKGQ